VAEMGKPTHLKQKYIITEAEKKLKHFGALMHIAQMLF
jgi:hypothetical protein